MDPREQIKAKIDIVQLIGEHIVLKQMGRNFKTICPFHGEKTPSFVVSPERQIWHCFGCGKGGDIFTFLMEFEKIEFFEALQTLAKKTGVKLTNLAPSKGEQVRERLLAINHLASEFYHYILVSHKAGETALEYLRKRGIRKETINTFKIGFAPAKWDLLLEFLTRKKGFTPVEVEEAGLVIRSQKSEVRSQKYYDRFRNRIMFTLDDHRGNVVGFAGRLLDTEAKEAKYVNTSETPLYHKGELFYGLDIVKEAIKKENQAIIVEGEFDMLSSFQEGIANIVALKGTAMTPIQAKLIRRFTQNIALAFDIDIAGDAAAKRAIEIAENEGLNIKVIRIKEGKDPDEAIHKYGIAGWKKAIKEAISIYDFIIDSAIAKYDKKTPEGKKSITEDVLPSLSTVSNEIVKGHFIKRVAQELDASEESVIKQMEKVKKQIPSVASYIPSSTPTALSRGDMLEEYLFAILIQKGDWELIKKIGDKIETIGIQNQLYQKLFSYLAKFYEKQKDFSIDAFVKDLPGELVAAADRLYLFDIEFIKPESLSLEVDRVLRDLKVLFLKKEMRQIAHDLEEKEKTADDKTLSELKKTFSSLSSQLFKLTAQSEQRA